MIFAHVNASDTGLASVTSQIYNQTNLVNQSTSATAPLSVNATGLPDATYYYNATACDETKCNSTETYQIRLEDRKSVV